MSYISAQPPSPPHGPKASPLILCDKLLALAQHASLAGYGVTAEHLLHLAHHVFEEAPHA